jgi:hypothetical protein
VSSMSLRPGSGARGAGRMLTSDGHSVFTSSDSPHGNPPTKAPVACQYHHHGIMSITLRGVSAGRQERLPKLSFLFGPPNGDSMTGWMCKLGLKVARAPRCTRDQHSMMICSWAW